jgi:DNA-binding GntR family transcriptional regulator
MKQHRVYQQLRRPTYTGQIKPGEKLVERRLAEEFETSRGPLRESLLRLTSEGLVRRSPRRTSYVDELTLADARDIYLMRLTLEPVAARLAALRPKRSFVRRLLTLTDRMARQVEQEQPVESAETDFEFHRQIVEASESERLLRAYDQSHVPMLISQMSPQWGNPEGLREIHLEIVQFIKDGAADEAEQAARQHVEQAMNRNVPAADQPQRS